MCIVVGLALAGTAYLAAMFNRKAKADLRSRLEPLAAAIDGEVDLEEATVRGRHGGALAFGRVANAKGGFGRLFHVEVVDAAGGQRWEWSNLPEKGQPEPQRVFEADASLRERLGIDFEALAAVVPDAKTQRWGFAYDPEAGMVRLSRAMRTRADIPDVNQFVAQLAALATLGDANRRAQGDSLRTPLEPEEIDRPGTLRSTAASSPDAVIEANFKPQAAASTAAEVPAGTTETIVDRSLAAPRESPQPDAKRQPTPPSDRPPTNDA